MVDVLCFEMSHKSCASLLHSVLSAVNVMNLIQRRKWHFSCAQHTINLGFKLISDSSRIYNYGAFVHAQGHFGLRKNFNLLSYLTF